MLNIKHTMNYTADAHSVAGLYLDPEYGRTRSSAFGAPEADIEVNGTLEEGFTVRTTVTAPTDMFPAQYRSFVGSSFTIVETQKWVPAGDSFTGEISMEVKNAPVTMNGTFSIDTTATGSAMTIDAETHVKIPLFGKKIEEAAQPYFGEVFDKEEANANEQLKARGLS